MNEEKITREMIDRVASRLGLPLDKWEQDWDLEMVAADDAVRLVGSYCLFDNPEDRAVLMRFTIAAYDDYLRNCLCEKKTPNPEL